MNDLDKILLTSGTTILGGLIIYSFNQIFQKFVLDPILNIRLLKGEIEDTLVFYANIYGNPGVAPNELAEEGKNRLRHLASQLSAKVSTIWLYDFHAFLHFIPSRENIKIAHSNLIGLSNSIYAIPGESGVSQASRNIIMQNKIRETLDINSLQ